ncbi:MAG: hypothetical protein OdinLCB4_006630 [Candidatus Odinarchaeum yellowstonii]|uniref:Peptidase S54 rhomboid domain-containing protein n=1 Tax=Odinarchaeota yellowstonii (strain LCB_4) TaxID=1841599 RepID=A0AAF0D1W9_ODILC|nr:MAG: hypothetical protein OdinLCB4_006630 [Candidatus Odinarchaeum yellowstonii]
MKNKHKLINYSIILLIILIPLTCILLFLSPAEIQQSLMLRTGELNPLTYLSSIFIHLNQIHLAGNLTSFLIISILLYIINWKTKTEKKFLTLMILTIFITPFTYNLLFNIITSLTTHETIISCGLSTAVAGLIGLTIPSLRLFLTTPIQSKSAQTYFTASLILLTISIITVSRLLETFYLSIFIITLAGSLLLLLKIREPIKILIKRDFYMKLRLLVTILTLIIYYTLVLLLFPANIVTLEGNIVDIIAHLAGLFSGIAIGHYFL